MGLIPILTPMGICSRLKIYNRLLQLVNVIDNNEKKITIV